jgi:hypothetical protein
MTEVITRIVDSGEFFEVHKEYAQNMIVRLRPPRRPLRRHRGAAADGSRPA